MFPPHRSRRDQDGRRSTRPREPSRIPATCRDTNGPAWWVRSPCSSGHRGRTPEPYPAMFRPSSPDEPSFVPAVHDTSARNASSARVSRRSRRRMSQNDRRHSHPVMGRSTESPIRSAIDVEATPSARPLRQTEAERGSAAGTTGWTTPPAAIRSRLQPPVRLTGRAGASAAGIETAELIVTDDAGTFVTRFRDLDPARLREWQSAADPSDSSTVLCSTASCSTAAASSCMRPRRTWTRTTSGTRTSPDDPLHPDRRPDAATPGISGDTTGRGRRPLGPDPAPPVRRSHALHPVRAARRAQAGLDTSTSSWPPSPPGPSSLA